MVKTLVTPIKVEDKDTEGMLVAMIITWEVVINNMVDLRTVIVIKLTVWIC